LNKLFVKKKLDLMISQVEIIKKIDQTQGDIDYCKVKNANSSTPEMPNYKRRKEQYCF